jgi:hypothetical protein
MKLSDLFTIAADLAPTFPLELLTFLTIFVLQNASFQSSSSLLFREYLKVADWSILPEECLHSFHFDFEQWPIIIFCLLPPMLPDADLSLGRSWAPVPFLQDEECRL